MKDKRSSSKSSRGRKACRRRTSFHKGKRSISAILQGDHLAPRQKRGAFCGAGPFQAARKSGTLIGMNDSLMPKAETAWISERARALGFDGCGVTAAERFPELERFSDWLDRRYAGEMKDLENPRP